MLHKDSVLVKETIIPNVTLEEVKEAYSTIFAFLVYLKDKKGSPGWKLKNAFASPAWAASEILYLGLYGYTKKQKFSSTRQYLKWAECPKTLKGRVTLLLGKDFSRYLDESKLDDLVVVPVDKKDSALNPSMLEMPKEELDYDSPSFFTDNDIQKRMNRYIEDFDLHSAVDQDLLRNLVITQLLIEREQQACLRGKRSINDIELKSLSEQVKNYISLLGLSKKDRIDFGAERQKGSVAELAALYETTKEEYPDLEEQFLDEELEMLLAKYDRRNEDGERELDSKTFRVWSGGFTVEEARERIKQRKKNAAARNKKNPPI